MSVQGVTEDLTMLSDGSLSVWAHSSKAMLSKHLFSPSFRSQNWTTCLKPTTQGQGGSGRASEPSAILPTGLVFVVLFLIGVTADSDDTHRRAGSVWDDNGLVRILHRAEGVVRRGAKGAAPDQRTALRRQNIQGGPVRKDHKKGHSLFGPQNYTLFPQNAFQFAL